MKNYKWLIISVLVLVGGFIALALGMPSGAILLEAQDAYMEEAEESSLKNMAFVLGDSLFMKGSLAEELNQSHDTQKNIIAEDVSSIISFGDENIDTLPLPYDFSPGKAPKEENFSEDGYKDSSIEVKLSTEEIDKTTYYTAHIKITHPSQLRTALAAPFGAKKTNKVSIMARENNAIIAINGDYYIHRSGYIIRQGEAYRNKILKSLHNLFIDEAGDFHITLGGDEEAVQKITNGEKKVINSFTFGPALVIDGQLQDMPEPKTYAFNIFRKEPRAAIGQIGPLEYVMVIAAGRSKNSQGATAEMLAEYMYGLGCEQAFNLDGGNSATMIFNGDYFNPKTKGGERSISDIIYFASLED